MNESVVPGPPKPGRLSHFEDEPEALMLPPRSRAGVGSEPVDPAPVVQQDPGPSVRLRSDRPRANRGSTVLLPPELIPAIAAACARERVSRGGLIIRAIERHWAEICAQITPPTPVGGSLFAQRKSAVARTSPTGSVSMNYSMPAADYATLDGLVDQAGASSRSELITVALTLYLT